MMEDKTTVTMNETYFTARLILEQAYWQAKCVAPGSPPEVFRITPDGVRDAANLVFLAMELIDERRKG